MAAAAAAAAEGAERARRWRASARSPSCRARTRRTSSKVSWTAGTPMHPDQKATLIELPEDADAQRQQMIQNANAKSDAYTRARRSTTCGPPSSRPTATSSSCPQDQFPTGGVPAAGDRRRRSTRTSSTPSRTPPTADCCTTAPTCCRPRASPPRRRRGRDDRRLQEDPGHRRRARASTATPVSSRSTRASRSTRPRPSTARAASSPTRTASPTSTPPEAKAGLDFLADGFKRATSPRRR